MSLKFARSKEQLRNTIKMEFMRVKSSLSFAKNGWKHLMHR
ncbi:hypothetical protein Mpsy_2310 [Methanolobus psychrophilus R15]|nr:hypothetical protein Mpsy_2310 [Methanolobus psychrophilus R15]